MGCCCAKRAHLAAGAAAAEFLIPRCVRWPGAGCAAWLPKRFAPPRLRSPAALGGCAFRPPGLGHPGRPVAAVFSVFPPLGGCGPARPASAFHCQKTARPSADALAPPLPAPCCAGAARHRAVVAVRPTPGAGLLIGPRAAQAAAAWPPGAPTNRPAGLAQVLTPHPSPVFAAASSAPLAPSAPHARPGPLGPAPVPCAALAAPLGQPLAPA